MEGVADLRAGSYANGIAQVSRLASEHPGVVRQACANGASVDGVTGCFVDDHMNDHGSGSTVQLVFEAETERSIEGGCGDASSLQRPTDDGRQRCLQRIQSAKAPLSREDPEKGAAAIEQVLCVLLGE